MLDNFDEDIRIMPDDKSKMFKHENLVADDNINLFIRQRSLGNTLKARKLGSALVSEMLDWDWPAAPVNVDTSLFTIQLKLLWAYIVHRVIEDCSPNQIVANATISTFYEEFEDADPDLFAQVNSSPAFSLYIYLHRSGEETAASVGKTFARLCDAPGNDKLIAFGIESYNNLFEQINTQLINTEYLN